MRGTIFMEATADGLNVQTAIEHVNMSDKIFIFQSLAAALHVTLKELGIFVRLMEMKVSEIVRCDCDDKEEPESTAEPSAKELADESFVKIPTALSMEGFDHEG